MEIADLDDFLEAFPDAEWLETIKSFSRYTNGEEEGSAYESAWFNDNTGLMLKCRPESI